MRFKFDFSYIGVILCLKKKDVDFLENKLWRHNHDRNEKENSM